MHHAYAALVWQGLHLAASLKTAHTGGTTATGDLLLLTLWNAAPYIILWLPALPPKLRPFHLKLIHAASFSFLLFYCLGITWVKSTEPISFDLGSISPFVQWPLTILVFWATTYFHTHHSSASRNAPQTLWRKWLFSKTYLWTPLFQAGLALPNQVGPGDEYFSIVLFVSLLGLSVHLPLILFTILGSHHPDSRPLANLGNCILLALPATHSLISLTSGQKPDLILFLFVLPMSQGFLALVFTLAAYVVLKMRDNQKLGPLFS